MTEETRDTRAEGGSLWVAALAAPAAFVIVALFTFVVAPGACALGLTTDVLGVSVLSVLTFLVAVGGLLVGLWGLRRSARNRDLARGAGAESDDASRFFATGGIMLSVLFIALTLIVGLSGLALAPCQPV
jgi:hypothetical protein